MTLKGWLVVAATAVGMSFLISSAEAAPVAGLSGLKPAGDAASGADKVFFRCWFGCPYYGHRYYGYYRPYYYRYPYYTYYRYPYRYPYYGYYRPYRYYSYYGPRYRWRNWW
jgi:hypothetical protein